MKFFYNYLYFLCIIFSGCNTNAIHNNGTNNHMDMDSVINIALEPSKKMIDFSSIGTIDSIIFLDTLYSLGEIKKLQVLDSFIYILDSKTEASFSCFSINGKFKWELKSRSNRNESPNEFIDFHVNSKNIQILDIGKGNILELSKEGVIEKKYRIKGREFYPDAIFTIPGQTNILHDEDLGDFKYISHHLTNFDSTFTKITGKYFTKTNNPAVKQPWLLPNPLKVFNTNLGFYYTQPMNDTVFAFSNNNFKKKYALNFGKYAVPENIKQDTSFTLKEFLESTYCGQIQNTVENDSLLFFTFQKGSILNFTFLDKKDNAVKVYGAITVNFILHVQALLPITSYGNMFFITVEPSYIINAYQLFKDRNPNKNEHELNQIIEREAPLFYKIKNKVSIYSNPVLLQLSIFKSQIFKKDE